MQSGQSGLSFRSRQPNDWSFGRAATDPVALPESEPWATCKLFVVPSIGSGEIAWAQRSGIRRREDALQRLDLADDPLNVHLPSSIANALASAVGLSGSRPFPKARRQYCLDRAGIAISFR